MTTMPILEGIDLVKTFTGPRSSILRKGSQIRAVDRVSISVHERETVALVGESGSGKSTLGRLLLRLLDPDDGQVLFKGQPVERLRGRDLRPFRRAVQVVFQDPFGSLDPRMRIGDTIAEGMRIHRMGDAATREKRAHDLLDQVRLPRDAADRYPHEFSGGQRQRIAIARALAYEPSVLICDEPVAALDMLVQAQVLNLLQDLKENHDLAMVFITHDLGVARLVADRIAVMQTGEVVEERDSEPFFASGPQHEYSRALLDAVPVPNPSHRLRNENDEGHHQRSARP